MENPFAGITEWYSGLPQAAQIGIPLAGAVGVFVIAKGKKAGGLGVTGPLGSSTGGGTAGGLPPNPAGSPPPPAAIFGAGGGVPGTTSSSPSSTGGASNTTTTSTPSSGTSSFKPVRPTTIVSSPISSATREPIGRRVGVAGKAAGRPAPYHDTSYIATEGVDFTSKGRATPSRRPRNPFAATVGSNIVSRGKSTPSRSTLNLNAVTVGVDITSAGRSHPSRTSPLPMHATEGVNYLGAGRSHPSRTAPSYAATVGQDIQSLGRSHPSRTAGATTAPQPVAATATTRATHYTTLPHGAEPVAPVSHPLVATAGLKNMAAAAKVHQVAHESVRRPMGHVPAHRRYTAARAEDTRKFIDAHKRTGL